MIGGRGKKGSGNRRGVEGEGYRVLRVAATGRGRGAKGRKSATKVGGAVARKAVKKGGAKKAGRTGARRRGGKAGVKKPAAVRGSGVRARRKSLKELLHEANGRAHDRANRENRRLGRKGEKLVKAAIALPCEMEEEAGIPRAPWWLGGLRLWAGAMLLPVVALTLWTFLSVFAEATMRGRFWTTTAFWYFATGVLLMGGWFWSGLLRPGFLYLYVLGHELTHVLFIWLSGGRIGEVRVTVEGGYVTTDRTNIIIALSPYFVPFWTAVVLAIWSVLQLFLPMPGYAEKILFWLIGSTWAFHALWTAWMIPRDQPDLQENGTFLSLGIIVLANTLILAAMLCVAWDKLSFREFGETWWAHARHWLHLLSVISREILGPPA